MNHPNFHLVTQEKDKQFLGSMNYWKAALNYLHQIFLWVKKKIKK